ncbi:unnamed protein product [Linum trigynum]|uniref:Uncharacterized protein n=1 Tax=Linum trigynum TaxID=586398 RepID=A0AAV2CJ31_9ROSI
MSEPLHRLLCRSTSLLPFAIWTGGFGFDGSSVGDLPSMLGCSHGSADIDLLSIVYQLCFYAVVDSREFELGGRRYELRSW